MPRSSSEISRRKKRSVGDTGQDANVKKASRLSDVKNSLLEIVQGSAGNSSRLRRSCRLQNSSSSTSLDQIGDDEDTLSKPLSYTDNPCQHQYDADRRSCKDSINSITPGDHIRDNRGFHFGSTLPDGNDDNSSHPFPHTVSSASTNASALTQYSVGAVSTGSAPKRRSKRLSSAKTELMKKQKSQLFSTVSYPGTNVNLKIGGEEGGDSRMLGTATLGIPTYLPPTLYESSQRKQIDIDAISSYIVSHSLPLLSQQSSKLIRTPSHDSHELTHLHKSTYGGEYYASLLEREHVVYTESRKRAGMLPESSNGRPRTRSFCKELEDCPKDQCSDQPTYIYNNFQTHINIDMRATLVNWIIGVAKDLKLNHETLHSCVKILDRGLEEIVVTADTFHTYGCACLLIASKLNEVKRHRAVDIAFFTDEACTPREICEMELQICTTLGFSLQLVNAFHFIDRFIDASHFTMGSYTYDDDIDDEPCLNVPIHARIPPYNPRLEATTLFILDAALLIPKLVDIKDSLIAAASLYLARAVVGVRDKEGMIWNADMAHQTGFGIDEIAGTVMTLLLYIKEAKNNPHMTSLRTKYKSREYFNVAYKVAILPQDLQFSE